LFPRIYNAVSESGFRCWNSQKSTSFFSILSGDKESEAKERLGFLKRTAIIGEHWTGGQFAAKFAIQIFPTRHLIGLSAASGKWDSGQFNWVFRGSCTLRIIRQKDVGGVQFAEEYARASRSPAQGDFWTSTFPSNAH
jgi:hypothetical protein